MKTVNYIYPDASVCFTSVFCRFLQSQLWCRLEPHSLKKNVHIFTLPLLPPFETAFLRVPEDLWLTNMKGHSRRALLKVLEAQNVRSQFRWSASLPPLYVNFIFRVSTMLTVCRFTHPLKNGVVGFTKRRVIFVQKHTKTFTMATTCSFRISRRSLFISIG